MYQFTNRKRPRRFSSLNALEVSQLIKVAERMWGEEELTPEEAFLYDDFGASCEIWRVERDGVHVYDFWADSEVWMDGVLFEAGTSRVAPVGLIQHHFTSLVQGFEEIAAQIQLGEKVIEAPRGSGSYEIREMRESDAEQIVALLAPIIDDGALTTMESISLQEQLDYMRAFPARGIFLVAEHQESKRLGGLQSIEPLPSKQQQHIAEVSTFVAMDAQRGYVGQSLMTEIIQRARSAGYLKLTASVRAENVGAVAFYEVQGFSKVGLAAKNIYTRGKYIDQYLLEMIFS